MQSPIIIKLGGSIITNKKGGTPRIQTAVVKRLARELGQMRAPYILLHGAGSFGHPLAHKHKLTGRLLSKEAIIGLGETTIAVRKLTNALATLLFEAGISVVPLQTSAFVHERKGKLFFTNLALIETILKNGGVPLLGGDGVVADNVRIEIASADRLAVTLARHFKSTQIYFATDVDGVYKDFPPQKGELALSVILRKDLERVEADIASEKDITGAMGGKLHTLLPLRNCTVTILNGLTSGALAKVILGKRIGTHIAL